MSRKSDCSFGRKRAVAENAAGIKWNCCVGKTTTPKENFIPYLENHYLDENVLFCGLKKELFFIQTEPLGTLEEEVLCLRLDSFKTAGNNFCGQSEDKFWRYLSLIILQTVFLAFSVDVVL